MLIYSVRKAEYLQKLNVDLSDNKTFWKTIKSYFSKQRFELKQINFERKEPTYYYQGDRGQNSGGNRLVAGLKLVVAARISRCNSNQSQLES